MFNMAATNVWSMEIMFKNLISRRQKQDHVYKHVHNLEQSGYHYNSI